jgi:single-strand DNA-binding protein
VSFQQVILIGHLGQDPEVRSTASGSKVANLSIATSEKWKDKESGEWKEKTEWHRVIVWGDGMVNYIGDKVSKGKKVFVKGKLQTRKWQDQDGKDRYSTEVVADRFGGFELLTPTAGSRRDDGDPGPADDGDFGSPESTRRVAAPTGRARADMDDEIPF